MDSYGRPRASSVLGRWFTHSVERRDRVVFSLEMSGTWTEGSITPTICGLFFKFLVSKGLDPSANMLLAKNRCGRLAS